MASRAPLLCGTPGCPRPAPCPDHPPRRWASGGARGKARPPRWDRTRARILDRDGYRCRNCGAPATHVDHIDRDGGENDSNLQSLCQDCHRRKTSSEAHAARRLA